MVMLCPCEGAESVADEKWHEMQAKLTSLPYWVQWEGTKQLQKPDLDLQDKWREAVIIVHRM